MLLPVVALPAELNSRWLGQEKDIVRSMGIVADSALPLNYRRMLRGRHFLPFYCVRMACPAKLRYRLLEKARLRRCVRSVAIETSVFADNGPVEVVLGKHLIDEIIMTPPAQLKTFRFQR